MDTLTEQAIKKAHEIQLNLPVTVRYDYDDFGGRNKWRIFINGESVQWGDVGNIERWLGVPRGTLPRFKESEPSKEIKLAA